MRYRIIAIGRLRRGILTEGCHHYQQRLEPYAKVEVLELKEGRGDAERVRALESAGMLAAAQAADSNRYLVALDERGRSWRTSELAAHVSDLELRGTSRITFLLGGAEGHHQTLRDEAQEVWRLSSLTLPHEMARLLLLEQLYRIETLRAGHPYHRE